MTPPSQVHGSLITLSWDISFFLSLSLFVLDHAVLTFLLFRQITFALRAFEEI